MASVPSQASSYARPSRFRIAARRLRTHRSSSMRRTMRGCGFIAHAPRAVCPFPYILRHELGCSDCVPPVDLTENFLIRALPPAAAAELGKHAKVVELQL